VFTSLIDHHIGTWGVAGQLTQPIFEGGRLRGNLREAQSQQRQELIAYKYAIKGAFKDVSDALIGYEKYHQVRVAQETTVQDLSDSVSTSLKRYGGGITTFLEVLDNQRSLFSAQLTLAQDRGKRVPEPCATLQGAWRGWQQ